MPGTFSQIYIQIVFAVKGRENHIGNSWKTELHKYIAGITKGKGHKPIIVNGMPDLIHAFVGLKPVMALSDLVRDIKNNASNFVNDHRLVKVKFAWQEGFGGFFCPCWCSTKRSTPLLCLVCGQSRQARDQQQEL